MPLWGKLIYNTFQFKYMYQIVCVMGGGDYNYFFFTDIPYTCIPVYTVQKHNVHV